VLLAPKDASLGAKAMSFETTSFELTADLVLSLVVESDSDSVLVLSFWLSSLDDGVFIIARFSLLSATQR